jgi:hypothetical protein
VAWLASPHIRNTLAKAFLRRYPGGYGVLSATLRLFSVVDPRGNIRELPPPHKLFEFHQIANRPELPVCQCASFFDPEVGGAWRERGGEKGHHPLCQFDRTAQTVFVQAAQSANHRLSEGKAPQARPDEWIQIRDRVILTGIK